MVGKPRREVVVQHFPAQEQAVEDGAVKCVDGELEIGILANLAALPSTLERGEHRFAARRDDITVEAFGEIGVVLHVGDEPRDDMTAGRLSQDGDEPAEQRADVSRTVRAAAGGVTTSPLERYASSTSAARDCHQR